MTVPQNSLVSYCRATEQEIEQLKHQATIKRERAAENKHNADEQQAGIPPIPQSSIKAVPRPTFFSQDRSLPFVIKEASVNKVNDGIRPIKLEYKDTPEAALRKEYAEYKENSRIELDKLRKEKDGQIAALREEMQAGFAALRGNANVVPLSTNLFAKFQPAPTAAASARAASRTLVPPKQGII